MLSTGRFGTYGGAYVPEILYPAVEQLERAFRDAQADPDFGRELEQLLRHYAGRPTPLSRCRRFGAAQGVEVWLKREDLLHGGAHKTNQVLAQGLLARRMGKTRLIAETGAGQHGVATAMVGALLGFTTRVYMGAKDVARQAPNVARMRLLGAEVVAVRAGEGTLKEAINEALRDWSGSHEHTHYLLGTVAGPHPYPTLVRDFQRVIGDEARAQFLEANDALPDAAIACVGGGSNAIGLFTAFLDDEVPLLGVEPGGRGEAPGEHGATLAHGRRGILHGAETTVLQDAVGQIGETHSVSAGLDYPAVGPEHAHLRDIGRVRYVTASDEQALQAFGELARCEGILPAFESAHALAHALRFGAERPAGGPPPRVLVNLSGRGDKDVETASELLLGEADHGS